MPGRGTVNTVFVLQRLSKTFGAKNKLFFFIFVDLGQAFDWVPRKVICFSLRWKDVP